MPLASPRVSSRSVAALVLCIAACKGDSGPPGPAGTVTSVVPDPTVPNLVLTITAARVTPDQKVQADYQLTDPTGAGIANANNVNARWTLAVLSTDPGSNLPAWQSLILKKGVQGAKGTTDQPTTDSNGTTENLGGGAYRYTYSTALPSGSNLGATYRTAVYATRPIPNTSGLNDVANGVLDFVPNGGTPQQHDLVSLQACNACHSILNAHGGSRRETRLCATCHTTQLFDPDTNDTGDPSQLNPLDFGRMVHRIHRGADLPTVNAANAANDTTWAYHVIGFGNSDNVFGGVIPNRNTASGQPPTVTNGVVFPRDLRGCAVCHSPQKDASGNVIYGGQSDQWQTAVSRRTCTSCHDSSWFKDNSPPKYHVIHQQATNPPVAAGTNPTTPAGSPPPGLVLADDSQCTTCHSQSTMASNHTSPFASDAFNPLTLTIDSVRVTTPPNGTTPGTASVTFTLKNKDGTPVTSLASLGSASLNMSGPTAPDFSGSQTDNNIVTVNVLTAGVATPTGTAGQYSANMAIPATASASWEVGLEARRTNATLTASERKLGHIGPTATFNEFGVNPVKAFTVSGTGSPTARRTVVAYANCNVCHETLSVHGGLRHDPQYCVMCHTPDNSDVARRPGTDPTSKAAATFDKLPERSIHLKVMIHSIHTGVDLQTQLPFLIYGFGGSLNFFDTVRFPSSRANCQLCHVNNASGQPSYTIDSLMAAGPGGALPTRAFQIGPSPTTALTTFPFLSCGGDTPNSPPGCTPVGPVTATCMACHDTPDAHAHAQAMTEIPIGSAPSSAAVETCAVCHAEGREFAVTRVHAQAASQNPE